jgi:signal transduction histidine kinase
MILNQSGKIVYHNPRSFQILRCTGHQVKGRLIDEIFEELALIDESKSQLPITIHSYLKKNTEIKNGTVFFKTMYDMSGNLAVSFFPLDSTMPKSEQLWLLSFFDITETLRDKLHRTRFVRAIGHELKHPLSSLKAYIYMIRKRLADVPPKTAEYLQQADEQIDILTAMLNDLTDVSKISLQEFEVKKEPQQLQALVHNIVTDFQVAYPDRKVTMKLGKTATKVQLDPIRFRQVLNNVLSNAVRYSDPNAPVLISVKGLVHEAVVSVQDQGEGINTEDIERIFDPYFRTKKGYQHKGLGLGLYIAREIMRRHDGDIVVKSKKGRGTTVSLHFPR